MEESQEHINETREQKNFFKKHLYLIILVIFSVFVSAGIFFEMQRIEVLEVTETVRQAQDKKITYEDATAGFETKDGKLYRNENYGIEFTKPEGYYFYQSVFGSGDESGVKESVETVYFALTNFEDDEIDLYRKQSDSLKDERNFAIFGEMKKRVSDRYDLDKEDLLKKLNSHRGESIAIDEKLGVRFTNCVGGGFDDECFDYEEVYLLDESSKTLYYFIPHPYPEALDVFDEFLENVNFFDQTDELIDVGTDYISYGSHIIRHSDIPYGQLGGNDSAEILNRIPSYFFEYVVFSPDREMVAFTARSGPWHMVWIYSFKEKVFMYVGTGDGRDRAFMSVEEWKNNNEFVVSWTRTSSELTEALTLDWKRESKLYDINDLPQYVPSSEEDMLRGNTKNIEYENRNISIVNIPPMQVSEGADFSLGSGEFKDSKLSPDGNKVAFSVRNASHDFAWVYDFKTKTFIPLSFQYGGGADVLQWEDNTRVTFELSTPKPSTEVKTFDLNNLSEYPKVVN